MSLYNHGNLPWYFSLGIVLSNCEPPNMVYGIVILIGILFVIIQRILTFGNFQVQKIV